MKHTPSVLGINRTQDASVCVMRGTSSICAIQKERLSRRKHDWGKIGDFERWYMSSLPGLREPVDLVVECFSSDAEISFREEYDREMRRVLRRRSMPPRMYISHHLAHVYGSFPLSPFAAAAVMVLDFQGSHARDITEPWPGREITLGGWLEVGSFYKCSADSIVCIGKQMWDGDPAQRVGLGFFYQSLTRTMFDGEGAEGKVMGLAPYGDPAALPLPPLMVDEHRVSIPREWVDVFRETARFEFFRTGAGSFQACADLAAIGQLRFEEALLSLSRWLHRETALPDLCLAGGTALNCVANGRMLREGPFREVFVPPSPHDGGTALGCAIYGLSEGLGVRGEFRTVTDFLGPEPSLAELGALVVEDAALELERPLNLHGRIIDLIREGRIVALFHGRSELGPRALGHRSILADPRRAGMREWINGHVKGRELFRPLAPVVHEDKVSRYFATDRPSPFMSFAVDVLPEWRSRLPAITHVDGTARVQTVCCAQDRFLYDLLAVAEAEMGTAVLLNTSFNGKDEPIVETLREALACFAGAPMHALAVPPFLIRKRKEPEIPPRTQ